MTYDCSTCDGRGGQQYVWDDDLGIRHEDWVRCSNCNGTGFSVAASGGSTTNQEDHDE